MKKFLTFLFCTLFICGCKKTSEASIEPHNQALERNSRRYKIFIIGDSMSSDDPGNISMIGNSTAKSYGWHLKQILDSTKYEFRNFAVSGVGIAEMRNQAQQIISERDASKINIVIILGCINNISFNGMTGQDCYLQMRAIHETLRSKKFETIGITLTSRRQLAYFTEQQSQYFWTQIVPANNLFISNQSQFSNDFINLQLDSLRVENGITVGFAGYEAATSSAYFLDGCHFSDMGKIEVANKLRISIEKL